MTRLREILLLAPLLAGLALAACTPAPVAAPPVDQREVMALTQTLIALGPEVDPDEAARAARISFEYASQLAQDWRVTDPPLIHNSKVNLGLRPRGLCYQWADDIKARLAEENFQTLDLHYAAAHAGDIWREHNSVIVSQRGDTLFQGVVLDGWRYGGKLFWSRTGEDPRYEWFPLAPEVDPDRL